VHGNVLLGAHQSVVVTVYNILSLTRAA